MTILFRPLGAFGWFSYTTSRDTIHAIFLKRQTRPESMQEESQELA
ncbi:hypothetical protein ACU5P1_19065 [Pseudomonas plecoglossicida]|nr:hypothetical protein [Pseudomonas plecoglossicida]QLB56720.1 hypothetical protein HAV28_18875 [Pseudomonas plecoglossicida]